MLITPKVGLSILFLLFFSLLSAQEKDTIKKVKQLPVPAFGYTPETGTYVGIVDLFTIDLYRDSLTRYSTAKLQLSYTWKKQFIFESDWDYFFKAEKWFSKGRVHASKFPDLYYGIGSNTPKENELSYSSNRLMVELSLLKNIGKKWFSGISLKYLNFSKIEHSKDKLIYQELKPGSAFGLAYSLLMDNRNSILTPVKGQYFSIKTGMSFATANYREVNIDYRTYLTDKRNTTFAFRLLGDFNFDTPPFYEYAFLGGDQFVRGYYLGRFRDNHLNTLQTEIRKNLFWRIGLAVFGGVSALYPDFNSLQLSQIKPNYGGGIRFLVDKENNTSLRLDYARGEDHNSGFYVSFGESF